MVLSASPVQVLQRDSVLPEPGAPEGQGTIGIFFYTYLLFLFLLFLLFLLVLVFPIPLDSQCYYHIDSLNLLPIGLLYFFFPCPCPILAVFPAGKSSFYFGLILDHLGTMLGLRSVLFHEWLGEKPREIKKITPMAFSR